MVLRYASALCCVGFGGYLASGGGVLSLVYRGCRTSPLNKANFRLVDDALYLRHIYAPVTRAWATDGALLRAVTSPRHRQLSSPTTVENVTSQVENRAV